MRLFKMTAVILVTASPAYAQLAVSANDSKVKLVNGAVQTIKDGKDTVAVIDLRSNPPKLIAEVEAPGSVSGPPTSVAISPNEAIALITSAEKIDPADPTKRIPDDRVTVLDLGAIKPGLIDRAKKLVGKSDTATTTAQPKILATLTAGKGAAGISFNKAGTLALVANRAEGTVSVFTVSGTTVTAAGKVELGDAKSGPSAVSFTPDGKMALVSMDGENANKIAILNVDGNNVTYAKRDMNAGIRPYGLDISKAGDYAMVANIGRGGGDSDTMSMIDLKATPPRVVTTTTVGQTPEGIKISPDGKYVAVNLMNGSNKPENSPFYAKAGTLQIWQRSGKDLSKVAEAPTGKWCQGIAWARDSKTILAQCMVEEEVMVYRFAGITSKALTKGASIKVKGGPAGIRTAE